MSDQPQPDTGALNASTLFQTVVTFAGGLSIDASGMTYLGKRIEDAGEAYAAFMAVTSGVHHQTETRLNDALVEIERLREERDGAYKIAKELYDMAIQLCKERGWFKHPTIDEAQRRFAKTIRRSAGRVE